MLRGHGNSTKRRNEKKNPDKAKAPTAFTAVVRVTGNDADCGQ